MLPLLLIAAAYLIGSIPFSYLVVRLMTGQDIRQHGSRNMGATKVARSFGASDRQIFLTVALPSSVPMLLTGLRLGLLVNFGANSLEWKRIVL